MDYTIHEFPFFSFILGDLHPHVMSVPFVILFVAVCWHYLRTPETTWQFDRRRIAQWVATLAAILVAGLALGGLAFTNMWDLPVFSALVVGVAALKAYSGRGADGWRAAVGALLFSVGAIIVALLLILPYLLSFTSQVSGISAVDVNTTRLPHLLIVWGLYLVAISPFIFVAFWRTTVDRDWGTMTVISLLVAFTPYVIWAFLHLNGDGRTSDLLGRLFHVLPLALLISVAVYSAMWLARQDRPHMGQVFALVLSTLGLLLIMGPELLYVDDAFGGANERMNTVFKLYYQGWILLAAASGYAIYCWRSLWERVSGARLQLTRMWAVIFIVLASGAAYYPLAAAATKGNLFAGDATLDGLSHLTRFNQGAEYRAIDFIRKDAGRDSAVLEAFSEKDYFIDGPFGRVSSSTGVPTVLGWAGHEAQWRGSYLPMEGRKEDIEAIYKTLDVDEAKNLLTKYRVDYVYVGRLERETYGEAGLAKFSTFMATVFEEGDVMVYRITRTAKDNGIGND